MVGMKIGSALKIIITMYANGEKNSRGKIDKGIKVINVITVIT